MLRVPILHDEEIVSLLWAQKENVVTWLDPREEASSAGARACPRGMPPYQSLAKGKELANPYEYFSSGQSRFTPFLQPAKGGNCLIEGVMPRPGH